MNFAFPAFEVMDTSGIDLPHYDRLLLQEDGHIRLLPYDVYSKIELNHLRVWANLRGRYGIPTVELVRWLKNRIGDRTALEVGAGCGNLGYHLGIPMTDSYQQLNDPATVAYFKTFGMAPVTPPREVIMEDADNAVRKRKPQVVIGSYLTQKFDPRDGEAADGNYLGAQHDYIIERCEELILIGNLTVHGKMRALKLPHEELYFPWIVTRSKDQSLNRIWLWKGKK